MSENSAISFHVSFKCKDCPLVFKSAQEYCSHKAEFHFAQLTKSRLILFEESTQTNQLQDFERVLVRNETQEITVNTLKDKIRLEVIKQELSDPTPVAEATCSSTNSTIKNPVNSLELTYADDPRMKTEWVEDTVIKCESPQQQNEHLGCHTNFGNKTNENQDYKPSSIYHEIKAQSSFLSFDDADLSDDGRVDDLDMGHDPLGNIQVAGSTFSTKTASDSDDDIICLDDNPLSPTLATSTKIATSKSKIGPLDTATLTPTETGSERLSKLILSQLKLRCQICSKKFASSAQLRIHVAICQLYNGKPNKRSTTGAAGPSKAGPLDMRSRVRVRVRHRRRPETGARNGCSFVDCKECGRGIRRSQLESHLRTEHNILVQDSDRKWICHVCDSAFRSNYDLKEHSMVHSDVRPFKCLVPECGREFKYERNLRHHAKSLHTVFN